ncbi:MAG: DNA double-strand break repair nuclease NurA, partial [Anaerolineae bacterium]
LDILERLFYNSAMPTDFRAIREQINQTADRFRSADAARREQIDRLCRAFMPDFDADALAAACVAVASDTSLKWNGALFNLGEAINQVIPFGKEPERYVLLASDGSQIMPDRHRPVLFALIQVACACVVYGYPQGDSPELAGAVRLAQQKDIHMLGESELLREGSDDIVGAGEITLERDLREIEVLAERCEAFQRAGVRAIALADGALAPFSLLNDARLRPGDRRLARFTAALGRLRQAKAVVAGYIVRPGSNAIAQSCKLAGVPYQDAAAAVRRGDDRARLVLDRHLLERALPSRHRTACFTPTWTINGAEYLGRDGHTMRAFYLNVGRDKPEIARVELPAWCADAASLDALTGILDRHCRMGGGYPFILKAAHEEAVLTRQDQREIERRLQSELQEQGVMAAPSAKQESKDKR